MWFTVKKKKKLTHQTQLHPVKQLPSSLCLFKACDEVFQWMKRNAFCAVISCRLPPSHLSVSARLSRRWSDTAHGEWSGAQMEQLLKHVAVWLPVCLPLQPHVNTAQNKRASAEATKTDESKRPLHFGQRVGFMITFMACMSRAVKKKPNVFIVLHAAVLCNTNPTQVWRTDEYNSKGKHH